MMMMMMIRMPRSISFPTIWWETIKDQIFQRRWYLPFPPFFRYQNKWNQWAILPKKTDSPCIHVSSSLSSRMGHIVTGLEVWLASISPLEWSHWYQSSYTLEVMYRMICQPFWMYTSFSTMEQIELPDGEVLYYVWSKCRHPPKYIIFIHHSLCYHLYEHAELAYLCQQKRDIMVFSFSRRGHYPAKSLRRPYFSSIGTLEDIEYLLEKVVRPLYPTIPIYGFASSAGTAMMALYLQKYGNESDIDGAVFVSSGYGLMDSLHQLSKHSQWNEYFLNRLHRFFIHPNFSLLYHHSSLHMKRLFTATTLLEWHQQALFFSPDSFFYKKKIKHLSEIDPLGHYQKIQKPLVTLHALNDSIFSYSSLQSSIRELDTSPWICRLVTQFGSHVMFRQAWGRPAWMYEMALVSFEQFHKTTHI